MILSPGHPAREGRDPGREGRRQRALPDGMTALLRAVSDERTLMGPFAFFGVMGVVF